MSYQVLALKYRPQTFDEVVGQNHVTGTLSNAISQDRVAHAILFTGPRGTGKTTIARVLAKAMNCENGPAPQPCNHCKICNNIIKGHCTDVFEIDGASNNSVDQIRDLRQNVTYMPSSAQYKIYIIDEVHMLSTAAFNALLKTLEEPPEHVMFIFATTEAHKIPATILSRCQRHDLSRIQLPSISEHLHKLSTNEGYTIEKQSLDLIAQEADGSIRDGLSLLDRVISFADTKEIGHERILAGLGIQDQQIMHDISIAIFNQDGAKIIDIIEKVNNSGIDLKKFYSDIIQHFRNYNIIKLCGKDTPAANITDLEKEKILQETGKLSSGFINTILQILLDEESIVRYSSHTKIAIEMVLLKLFEINPGAQIDQIINKLNTLSQLMDSKVTQTTCKIDSTPSFDTDKNLHNYNQSDYIQKNNSQAVEEPASSTQFQQSTSDPAVIQKIDSQKPTWQEFLNKIEQKFPVMFALLSKGVKKEKSDNEIIIELANCSKFENSRIESKKKELQIMCQEFLGKDLAINIISQNTKLPQNADNKQKNRQAALNHPMVVEAQAMFNGQIIN